MILRCPSCTARLESPTPPAGGGGLVSCNACGHDWIEAQAIETEIVQTLPALHTPEPRSPSDAEIERLVLAGREAQEKFVQQRMRRRMMAAAWAGLGLLAAAPLILAFAIPERVVAAVPASISLYDRVGRKVNIYGVEIREVELQHLLVDGQRVIAVKGEVVNVSSDIRKIPWLRFALRSGDGREVYQWQLDTEARPLRPGEGKNFVTRIGSPPEVARNVEIRFARGDEIGSNTPHE